MLCPLSGLIPFPGSSVPDARDRQGGGAGGGSPAPSPLFAWTLSNSARKTPSVQLVKDAILPHVVRGWRRKLILSAPSPLDCPGGCGDEIPCAGFVPAILARGREIGPWTGAESMRRADLMKAAGSRPAASVGTTQNPIERGGFLSPAGPRVSVCKQNPRSRSHRPA